MTVYSIYMHLIYRQLYCTETMNNFSAMARMALLSATLLQINDWTVHRCVHIRQLYIMLVGIWHMQIKEVK